MVAWEDQAEGWSELLVEAEAWHVLEAPWDGQVAAWNAVDLVAYHLEGAYRGLAEVGRFVLEANTPVPLEDLAVQDGLVQDALDLEEAFHHHQEAFGLAEALHLEEA